MAHAQPSKTTLPRSSLLPSLPIHALDSHTYTTTFLRDFAIGTVPHGGYIASAFQRVASLHFARTLAAQNQPDTFILQLNYLRRTSVGPAQFVVRDVKLGSRTSTVHIELRQNGVTEVVAYLTQTNTEREEGPSLRTGWTVSPSSPEGAPAVVAGGKNTPGEKWQRVDDLPYANFRRATAHVELWIPRADVQKDLPAGRIDQWMRMRSGERWTNEHLGYVADYFPLLIEVMEPGGALEASQNRNPSAQQPSLPLPPQGKTQDSSKDDARPPGAKYWYPTLALNLEIKKRLPANGVEWLRSVVQMRHISNGRHDLELVIYDVDGQVLASSHHVCLVVPVERNVSARRKDRGNSRSEKGERSSKI